MPYDMIIQGGTVVTASDRFVADIGIKGERVETIAPNLPADGAQVVDAKGCFVLPGAIDVHSHLDMPFGGTSTADDFESGTISAACGGTTTVVDFAIQFKGQSPRQGLDAWHKRAEGKACVDYGFHLILTELPEGSESQLDALVNEGVSSFKVFMAYPGVFMLDDATIFRLLRRTREIGALTTIHCENGGAIDVLVKLAREAGEKAPKYHALTRPARAEAEATARAIALAEIAKAPIYIVHLSAAEALDQVRVARDRGLAAYAETCPQYLFLSYKNYEEPGFEGAKYVMSPPLREPGNEEALWKGLKTDELQVVSTDHCSFCMSQKALGKDDFSKIPNGAPGLETRLYLLYDGGVRTGRISLERMVDLTATKPAKMFGLYPKKGTLSVGSDADLVVWDPEKKFLITNKSLHHKADYTPYEGRTVTGAPRTVLQRGQVIVKDNTFVGKPGGGRFLRRGTFRNP